MNYSNNNTPTDGSKLKKNDKITITKGYNRKITLYPAKYLFQLSGQKGGEISPMQPGSHINHFPSLGAYISCTLDLEESLDFYLNNNNYNNGHSGTFLNGISMWGCRSGSGGVSSDVRVENNNYYDMVLCAAGGGGVHEYRDGLSNYSFSPSSLNTGKVFLGENAPSTTSTLNNGPGGGGGYLGGCAGDTNNKNASGGTSYISGYNGCWSFNQQGTLTSSPKHYSGIVFKDIVFNISEKEPKIILTVMSNIIRPIYFFFENNGILEKEENGNKIAINKNKEQLTFADFDNLGNYETSKTSKENEKLIACCKKNTLKYNFVPEKIELKSEQFELMHKQKIKNITIDSIDSFGDIRYSIGIKKGNNFNYYQWNEESNNWTTETIGNTKEEIQQLTVGNYEKLNSFFNSAKNRTFIIKSIVNKNNIYSSTELLKIQITTSGKPYLQSKKINNCKIKNKFDKIEIDFYEDEDEVKIIYKE